MMKHDNTLGHRMLKLIMWDGADARCLNTTATLIRSLPQVLRVRVDLEARVLEILHEYPALNLIQTIHSTWLMAGGALNTWNAYRGSEACLERYY